MKHFILFLGVCLHSLTSTAQQIPTGAGGTNNNNFWSKGGNNGGGGSGNIFGTR